MKMLQVLLALIVCLCGTSCTTTRKVKKGKPSAPSYVKSTAERHVTVKVAATPRVAATKKVVKPIAGRLTGAKVKGVTTVATATATAKPASTGLRKASPPAAEIIDRALDVLPQKESVSTEANQRDLMLLPPLEETIARVTGQSEASQAEKPEAMTSKSVSVDSPRVDKPSPETVAIAPVQKDDRSIVYGNTSGTLRASIPSSGFLVHLPNLSLANANTNKQEARATEVQPQPQPPAMQAVPGQLKDTKVSINITSVASPGGDQDKVIHDPLFAGPYTSSSGENGISKRTKEGGERDPDGKNPQKPITVTNNGSLKWLYWVPFPLVLIIILILHLHRKANWRVV